VKFFKRMQELDRRWIYIIIALAIVVPLMIPFDSDNLTTPSTENLYQMIDSFSGREDRAILMSFAHDASTMPELFPMEVAILRHCFERNIKVFTFSNSPLGAPIIDYAINTVKDEYPQIESGVHYCNFGYKPNMFAIVIGMGDNIATTMNVDAEGRKVETLPIMRGITNYTEMNLVVEFSGSVAGGTWIVYARPKFGLNVAVGVTAVMAADQYPYLQSGQLIGMLSGLKGAAEYEKLVDVFATNEQSFSSEKLSDPRIRDLIRITTQSVASFTQTEFTAFLNRYPQQKDLIEKYREEKDGIIQINWSQIPPQHTEQLGFFVMDELQRKANHIKYSFKTARVGMNAQSVAHIVMIVFIILGNLGYFVQKLSDKK